MDVCWEATPCKFELKNQIVESKIVWMATELFVKVKLSTNYEILVSSK